MPVLRQAQQARKEDRPAAQIEAMLEVSLDVVEHLGAIDRDHRQSNALRRGEELHGVPLARLTIVAAQAPLARDDFTHALLERPNIEVASDEQQEREIVARVVRVTLVVEP